MCRKEAGWSYVPSGCAVFYMALCSPADMSSFVDTAGEAEASGGFSVNITPGKIDSLMRDCVLCPRKCHADRRTGRRGFCGQSAQVTAARAALHFWEEPCISGSCGSGTVFFTGCSLQCIFCQNQNIALKNDGHAISLGRLTEIFLELQKKGAANINLVTAGHFLPQVAYCLEQAKNTGLSIPVVYNTGSYEEVDSLKMLEGLVDIYLPDLKYHSPELSLKYARADDYFEKAAAAIKEMFRQTGRPQFDLKSGLMQRGVIVRHLLLPGCPGDSKRILRYLHDTYGNDIFVSIMNQFTPLDTDILPPKLRRKISHEEYEKILDFADRIGIEQGFRQEGETASESFIPVFNGEGL